MQWLLDNSQTWLVWPNGTGSASTQPLIEVSLTGLENGVARIGSHGAIGYTIDPDNGTETVAWGATPGGTEYGTDANPTDFTAGDGGTLYLRVTQGGETVTRSAAIRYAQPVATGGLADQSFTENTGIQTYDASVDFAGDNLTFSVNSVAGVSINPSSGVVSFNTDVLALQSGTSIIVTATNSGGSDASGLSLEITAAPTVPVVSILSVGPQDGAGGDVPVSYTISENATCEAVLYLATEPAPGAGDFGGAGAPTYIDLGPLALTTAGTPVDLAVPDGLENTYKLALLPAGGGDGDVVESGPVSVSTPTVATGVQVQRSTLAVATTADFISGVQSGTSFTAQSGSDRMLVAIVSYVQGSNASDLTATLGAATFTLATSYGSSTNGLARTQFLYLLDADIPATAETLDVSITGTFNTPMVTIVELSGVNQTTPFGNDAEANSTNSALETRDLNVTTQADDRFVLSVMSTNNTGTSGFGVVSTAGTPTIIPEHTQPSGSVRNAAAAYETVAAAGVLTHTWSWTTGARTGGRVIEIIEA